jgi:hypothetical protein
MNHDDSASTGTHSGMDDHDQNGLVDRRPRRRRMATLAAVVVALAALGTACTPEQVQVYTELTAPTREVLTDDQLFWLRNCESHGSYEAVSANGLYRGAYQFLQSTWDSVADRHYPWLVGRDPATVEPWWQDAMTRALWSERGRSPWPVCGRRI